jgi:uncharacterized CHY-type Zn-finger protein
MGITILDSMARLYRGSKIAGRPALSCSCGAGANHHNANGAQMECAYCERPLICDGCHASYEPPTAEEYGALSADEETIICPACGEVLVCHWCKEAYDGGSADATTEGAPPAAG